MSKYQQYQDSLMNEAVYDPSSDGAIHYKVGDVVTVYSHVKGTNTGRYGKFNVSSVSSTMVSLYDTGQKKDIKFNLKIGRGIGDASELLIK